MHYIYDGSFEGLLTAVFYAFNTKQTDCEILSEKLRLNISIFDEIYVPAEKDKAERVLEKCREKISPIFLHDIYYLYLSELPQSGTLIKDYIIAGMKYGKYVYQYMHLPVVCEAVKIRKKVGNEAHRLKGLIRFSIYTADETEIYYADITPDFNVLPVIYHHFERRMPALRWIIRDLKRRYAAIHFDGKTLLADAEEFVTPDTSKDEIELAWREFYKSIAIDERINPKLRKAIMPQRYWSNMTEFR